MRPLLVLLLVIVALAAFFFAYNAGPGTSEPTALSGPGTQPVATTSTSPTDLVVDPAPERGAVAQQDPERAAVSTSGESNVLTGLVVDAGAKGEGIEGASVTLTRVGQTTFLFSDENFDRADDRTAKTNASGRYTFQNVEPYRGYALIVRHPDYAQKEIGNVNVGQGSQYEEPPIRLDQGLRLHGTVTDTAGNLVPGAQLYMSPMSLGTDVPDGPDTLTCQSGDDGKYEFKNVADGNYTLQIRADGYGRLTVQSLAMGNGEDMERDFQLEVAHMIAGRVMSRGNPVERAVVRAYSMSRGGNQSRSEAKSNKEGEWEVQDIPAGTYTLLVEAPGFKTKREQRIDTGNMGVMVELTPLPRVEGTVVDAASGQPLTRFKVRLRESVGPGNVPLPVEESRAKQDKEGKFALFAPKPGNYVVEGTAESYAGCFSDVFTITEGQTIEGVTVKMTTGGVLRGRVVDSNGKPVARAVVTSNDDDWTDDPFMQSLGEYYPTLATRREVRTDSDGAYEIKGLSPALYQVDVQHAEYTRNIVKGLQVTEGETTAVEDVVLARGATVRGTVYEPSGKPLAGSVVQLTSTDVVNGFPLQYEGKTDAKGNYEIRHVRTGTYDMRALRTAEAGANPFQNWEDLKVTERKLTVASDQEYNGEDFRLGAASSRGR